MNDQQFDLLLSVQKEILKELQEIRKQILAGPALQSASSVVTEGPTVDEVLNLYTQEQKNRNVWTEKTEYEYESSYSILRALIGTRPVNTLTRPDMLRVMDDIAALLSNLSKKLPYRDMTIQDILRMNVPVADRIAARTVNKLMSRLSAVLKWAQRNQMITSNPAEGLQISIKGKAADERKVYDASDLQRLAKNLPTPEGKRPERYWIPLIGLFSGMRLNEICQLDTDDVKPFEGVWCFHIHNGGDKRLKTVASERIIPVHPYLIEHGFLEYAKSNTQIKLWPNLKKRRDGYAADFSKWFQTFNRRHITKDEQKVFHSFRHGVGDRLKQLGVDERHISEILGHSHKSITSGRYGKAFQPAVLKPIIAQLDFLNENK